MERLLIVIPHGDGYTYHAEDTKPILFSSKDEFIITLEDTVNDYLQALEKYRHDEKALRTKHKENLQDSHRIIERFQRSKPSDKIQKSYDEAISKTAVALKEVHDFEKNRPSHTFELGGQTFEFDDFIAKNDNSPFEKYVVIPEVYTLDEYFAPVEPLNTPQSKALR